MKIVLDVDKLLADGRIGDEEYARLKAYALEDTGSLAFNILVGFGVIATAGGALALAPSAQTAVVLGVVLSTLGVFVCLRQGAKWGLLGSIMMLVGSVMAGGGLIGWTDGAPVGFLVVTVLYLGTALLVRSSLMAVLAALALSSTIGAATAYGHAMYMLVIRQPTLTVVVFAALGLGAYALSKRMPPDLSRVAIAFSRTALFLVNMGFWVGSLWGDSLWRQREDWEFDRAEFVPDWVFVVAWAVALIATGIWATRQNKRWVVNLLAVFAAIHFYTQYFERLGASPGTILIGGLVAIGIAVAIVRYNRSGAGRAAGAAPSATGASRSSRKNAERPLRPESPDLR